MNCCRHFYLSLFAFGAMFIAIQEIDAAPILLSQNLGASAYSANGGNAALAFDGNFSNLWNSNGFAPAWIEVDLGSVYSLEEFRLRVDQTPSGNTTHQIWVSNSAMQSSTASGTLVHTFSQFTSSNDTLSYIPSSTLLGRFVQIRTTASPSWVAWKEVQVFGSAVPEPASGIVMLGGLAVAWVRRRRLALK